MTNEQQLVVIKTTQVLNSIDILLDAYKEWEHLSSDTVGGRRYECLLEAKRLAKEWQSNEIITSLNNK